MKYVAQAIIYLIIGYFACRIALAIVPNTPLVIQLLIAFIFGVAIGVALNIGWKRR